MKKWLKIILSIIGGTTILIVSSIGIVVTDFTNNTPDYISEVKDVTTGDLLSAKVDSALKDMDISGEFKYIFNEHEINNILATIVPNIKVPGLNIKSIYVDIGEEGKISAEAPFWMAFYRSCLKANGTLTYKEKEVVLTLDDIKLGRLSETRGLTKAVLNENNIANINETIVKAGVHLTIERRDDKIVAVMTDLDIIKTIVECTDSPMGWLYAALAGGFLNNRQIKVLINENGYTGIIVDTNPII
ncbi:MAG: hypothetical protein MJ238_02835 [Bacilli bacterium]|nr:hypothetical protein [Bacilli bacterium]